MENLDHNEMPENPISQASPAPQQPVANEPEPAAQQSIPPRKASPFADSPYEMEGQISEPVRSVKPKKQKKTGAGTKVLAVVLVLALIAAGCGFGLIYRDLVNMSHTLQNSKQEIADLQQVISALREEIKDNSYTGNGNSVSGTPNQGTNGGLTPGQVYAQNVKSVVAISSEVLSSSGQSASSSSGTGFVISENGYVVTNYHVVDSANKIHVTLYDGTKYIAKFIGGDEPNDLAVLKMEATGLQAAKLGSSSDLIVGDMVVAIGNPLGELTSTLTVGYVSAKDRDINTSGALINMIQTDAAINPGNSGGPLFNMNGEVVGITTAKYSGTTGSGASIEGIGFAIPMDDVLKKITDLRDYGYINSAYLGITVSDCDPNMAMYGIPMGAYVREVNPGSCAEKAGLKAMDIILAVGEFEVGGLNELSRAMQNFQAGDTTVLTVWRAGQQLELTITLDPKPAA